MIKVRGILHIIMMPLLLLLGVPAGAVGFQWDNVPNGNEEPLDIGIWYPSDATVKDEQFGPFRQTVALDGPISGTHLPLVVFSHGTGGSPLNSYDTAIALANAGFIVVAVTHLGDNYMDHNDSFTQWNFVERPRHVSAVLDYMLASWPKHSLIDPKRIGIFGHSAGGTTALVAVGGIADWARIIDFCRENPEDWGCKNARQHVPTRPVPVLATSMISGHDSRIKAAVVAAPAVSSMFKANGLRGVKIPVQLWVGSNDTVVTDAAQVRGLLPSPPDFHLVSNGGHFAYLAPCSESLNLIASEICQDPIGFDRVAFLHQFQQSMIAFFKAELK